MKKRWDEHKQKYHCHTHAKSLGEKEKHFHTQFLSTAGHEHKESDEQTSCSPLNKINEKKIS